MKTPKKRSSKKVWKEEGWGVFSIWGFHAWYQLEKDAHIHWKNSKKNGIEYKIMPLTINYSLPK